MASERRQESDFFSHVQASFEMPWQWPLQMEKKLQEFNKGIDKFMKTNKQRNKKTHHRDM